MPSDEFDSDANELTEEELQRIKRLIQHTDLSHMDLAAVHTTGNSARKDCHDEANGGRPESGRQICASDLSDRERKKWLSVLSLCEDLFTKKPWTWMSEVDIIGIERRQGNREQSLVTTIGYDSHHKGINFYLGDWGEWALLNMLILEEKVSARIASRVMCRLNSFRVDYMLAGDLPADYARFVRDLGFTFRGGWPHVSMLEGAKPIRFPEGESLDYFEFLLNELLAFYTDLEAAHIRLPNDREQILLRYWSEADNKWLYRKRSFSSQIFIPAPADLDEPTVQRIGQLPGNDQAVSVDYFRLPASYFDVEEKTVRLFVFIATDDESGKILSMESNRADRDEFSSWVKFLLDLFRKAGRPSRISVDDEIPYVGLAPVLEQLDIDFRLIEAHPLHDFLFSHLEELEHTLHSHFFYDGGREADEADDEYDEDMTTDEEEWS